MGSRGVALSAGAGGAGGGLRLGIDVGGTNTDAVIMDSGDNVRAKTKVQTTPDATGGISEAIAEVIGSGGIDPAAISHVMLGTTHATNAVLERRELGRVAVVRVAGPATELLPPMVGWPDDLRQVVSAGHVILPGGNEMDGSELHPLDLSPLEGFFAGLGPFDAVAVVGVFSPVSNQMETDVQRAVSAIVGDGVPIVLSHEVGSMGLIERENATILNAALAPVAKSITGGVQASLEAEGIDGPTYFAQNDGTLMALDHVRRLPVLTIGSGPANSMRGAAYLSGLSDALIADVGGTSTDVGVLANGFPRTSALPVDIGGVKTNFRMPDLVSVALGGGTIVQPGVSLTLGPRSVGYRIASEALAFGGSVMTTTDAAVAAGRATVGTAMPELDRELAGLVLERCDEMIADAVDRVKLTPGEQPLIAVGGGSFLASDDIEGVSEVVRPPHHEVANAIGAAIASVSGEVDRLYDVSDGGREKALERARADAIREAVGLGADPDGTEIIDIEEFNVLYLSTDRLRIRAKAAGPLALI